VGLFSVLAPIGLLDSGSNLIWTCNVKWTFTMASHRPPPSLPPFPVWKGIFGSVFVSRSSLPFRARGEDVRRCSAASDLRACFPAAFDLFYFLFPLSLAAENLSKEWRIVALFFGGTIAPQFLSSNFLAHWTKISQTISDSPGRNKISPKRARPCEIPLHIPSGSRLPHFAVLFSAFPDGAIVNAFLFPFLEEFRVGCFMDQPPLLFPSGFKNCCMQTSLRYSLFCVQFSSAIFFSLVSSFWCTPPFVEYTLRTVRVCIYVDEHSVARLCLTWQIGVFSAADCQNLRVAVHLLHDPSNRDHITKYCFILESHSIW
jgi:hypothetical protein